MSYIAPRNVPAPRSPKIEFTPQNKLNGGLDLVDMEWKIGTSKTNKTKNTWFNNGELGKRWGQSYLDTESFVWDDTKVWDDTQVWDDTNTWIDTFTTPTFSVYKTLYQGYIIKHCGTVLYKQNPTTGKLYIIKTGLTAKKGSFFTFNGTLYFRQTGNYISWDGTIASVVTPYIPLIIQNRNPTGSGDLVEGYNRIGAGFTNAFITNGSATAFTLTDTNLDATIVTASNDSGVTWSLIEGTNLSVNRVTGVVTMTVAPATNTNVFRIKAYKTDTADVNSILDCLHSATFGGDNNNRVFAAGNGTGVYYWTGISSVGADVTYWDFNNYNVIGDNDEDITGLAKQYDTLCIFKAKEIYGTTYSFDGTVGVFKHFPVNSKWGCDAPNSIQNINNNLVWLNSGGGGYTLLGSAVESQRNVQQITRNINPLLLAETKANLQGASSVDANGKYWLCVGDKVYLWDYFISPYIDSGNPDEAASRLSWWYMDNINSYGFVSDGLDLYHVDRTNSKSVVFQNLLHDFEVGIPAYWRLPMRDYGQGAFYFDVIKAFIDVRGDTKTTINVTYYTSDDEGGIVDTEVFSVGSFSLNNFSLENFTLDVMSTKTTFTLIPNEKNIELFGIEFQNSDYGRDLNLSNVILEYKVKKEKR